MKDLFLIENGSEVKLGCSVPYSPGNECRFQWDSQGDIQDLEKKIAVHLCIEAFPKIKRSFKF